MVLSGLLVVVCTTWLEVIVMGDRAKAHGPYLQGEEP
jgi:hypothetical protein